MLQPSGLSRIHAIIQKLAEPADGWLLFDFRGFNPIMAAVMGSEIVGSRRQYIFIPKDGPPVALLHMIDAELWRHWPAEWKKIIWVRRDDLGKNLKALVGGKTVAMEYSPSGNVPYADYVPAGTLELVRSVGATPVSSAELVTRYCSAWSPEDLASHRRAAAKVADIARAGIALMGERSRSRAPLTEHDLTRWTLEAIDKAGLMTESAPSVSYGDHAARAHYEAPADGSYPLVPGALVLYDLWAKEKGGVYADQTWMASLGPPSAQAEKLWTIVRGARDAAIAVLDNRLRAKQPVTGAEADRASRQVIVDAGYGDRIICRTGHSIDRMGIHGFGPTIDDTESFDLRQILPGVGFSIEPGIYIPGEIGLRSEVNGYAGEAGLEVTPTGYQNEMIVV